jgi:hypothetical protein
MKVFMCQRQGDYSGEIEDFAKQGIHVSTHPYYFCGTILGWEVDIISFDKNVESKINACGRYDKEEDALCAGIEYVRKQLLL